MKILLILVVVAMALAPLTYFIPGKRQRRIVRLREYAAVHGLFVEFRDMPGASPAPERTGKFIYYGQRLSPAVGQAVGRGAWIRTGDEWVGVHTRLPVPSRLRELPVEILAGSVDESSCGVYWTESGEEDSVELIRLALGAWAADLAG